MHSGTSRTKGIVDAPAQRLVALSITGVPIETCEVCFAQLAMTPLVEARRWKETNSPRQITITPIQGAPLRT